MKETSSQGGGLGVGGRRKPAWGEDDCGRAPRGLAHLFVAVALSGGVAAPTSPFRSAPGNVESPPKALGQQNCLGVLRRIRELDFLGPPCQGCSQADERGCGSSDARLSSGAAGVLSGTGWSGWG